MSEEIPKEKNRTDEIEEEKKPVEGLVGETRGKRLVPVTKLDTSKTPFDALVEYNSSLAKKAKDAGLDIVHWKDLSNLNVSSFEKAFGSIAGATVYGLFQDALGISTSTGSLAGASGSQGSVTGNPSNQVIAEGIREKLESALKARNRTPDDSIMIRLFSKHYPELERISMFGSDALFALYDEVYRSPHTDTRSRILSKFQIKLNGPLTNSKPSVLTGVNNQGIGVVVKIINSEEEDRILQVILPLQTDGLIQGKLISIPPDNASKLPKRAIVMPRLGYSVDAQPSLFPAILLREGRRLKDAVRVLHKKKIAHMDIKTENILVDEKGRWHLADFDFARTFGTPLPEMYTLFPRVMQKHVAHAGYDWVLLGITLAIEFCCRDDVEKVMIQGRQGVDIDKLKTCVELVPNSEPSVDELKKLIFELLGHMFDQCPTDYNCYQCKISK